MSALIIHMSQAGSTGRVPCALLSCLPRRSGVRGVRKSLAPPLEQPPRKGAEMKGHL